MTGVAFHIDQLFFRAPGGIGTYIRRLVPALARRDPGLDVRLFHARFGRERPEDWIDRFRVEEIPATIRRLYPQWDLLGRPALPPSLAAMDVVHAPLPAAIPPAAPGQRLVVTVHDLAFAHHPELFPRTWRVLFKLGLRAAVRRADAILTPSRNTAEDLLSMTGVDPARLHAVPLAASLDTSGDDPQASLARLGVSPPYILFVGTLEPRKNLVRLVRAYRRVAASGLPHSLVLAGPAGWGSQALDRELALDGPGRVLATGALAEAEIDALYRGADVFVYPSLYEGFGLPVLEAMVRGVPTVASNTSSLPEVTGDAVAGVDPTSVGEIGAAIESLLRDPEGAGQLAARGRARSERFSWDETARLTLEVYEKAARG